MQIPQGYIQTSDGLWLREAFLHLTPEAKAEICNGIGAASGLTKNLPSTIWGLDCHEAGDIHDYDYHVGGTAADRRTADLVFLHNLYVIIKRGWRILAWIRNIRARTYYVTLRLGGWMHFKFINESEKASDIGETVLVYPVFEHGGDDDSPAKENE